MKYVHTIQLSNEKNVANTVSGKRESVKQYGACVVLTTTEETIRLHHAEEKKLLAAIETAKANRAAAIAESGLSVEEAQAAYDAISDAYHGGKAALHAAAGGFDRDANEKIRTSGIEDPCGPRARLLLAVVYGDRHVEMAENALDRNRKNVPVLGSEGVWSWAGTVALGEKAAIQARKYAKGDAVSVRTDIAIVAKGKK